MENHNSYILNGKTHKLSTGSFSSSQIVSHYKRALPSRDAFVSPRVFQLGDITSRSCAPDIWFEHLGRRVVASVVASHFMEEQIKEGELSCDNEDDLSPAVGSTVVVN